VPLCPAGKFCATATSIEECPSGSYCPRGTFAPIECYLKLGCLRKGQAYPDIFAPVFIGISLLSAVAIAVTSTVFKVCKCSHTPRHAPPCLTSPPS
jgi:hypothetical protein